MPNEPLHACPDCASVVARSGIEKHKAWHAHVDDLLNTPVITEAESVNLTPWPVSFDGIG